MAAYISDNNVIDIGTSSIKEGFLCPMCLQDLQSFHNLQSHFESEHTNEDKAVVSQIKGLFSRAKDKLLGKEYEDNDDRDPFTTTPSARTSSYQQLDPAFWEPQELGVFRCRMDKFKTIRDARIDRVVIETNKIVIRLDKLLKPVRLKGKPNDRDFEQNLVPWVQDEDVPFCPTCGDKFNVARRKHHCRLCGAIMCTKCSIFLPFQVAEDLVKKINKMNENSAPRASRRQQEMVSKLSDEDIEKIFVRICYDCDKVLQRNKEKLDRKHNPSLLVVLHEKMQAAIESAIKTAPEYQRMADSLNHGDEEYKLGVATEKRFKLMQMFEAVDVISKKIAVLDTEDEENPPSNAALRLQTAIRKTACAFLQENMLCLPSLPSQPKLQVLQAQRRAENERRLRIQREEARKAREEEKRRQEVERLKKEREDLERQRKLEQIKESSTVQYSPLNNQNRPNALIVKDPGWSADTISITSNTSKHSRLVNYASDSDDEFGDRNSSLNSRDNDPLYPLLEQIEYVKESAKQAQAAGMEAEAESLKKNMEELKAEYKRQSTARAFAVTPSTPPENPIPATSPLRSYKPSLKMKDDTGEDPLLQQMRYISQCIDEATFANRLDEARILSENLNELKAIYKQHASK